MMSAPWSGCGRVTVGSASASVSEGNEFAVSVARGEEVSVNLPNDDVEPPARPGVVVVGMFIWDGPRLTCMTSGIS